MAIQTNMLRKGARVLAHSEMIKLMTCLSKMVLKFYSDVFFWMKLFGL